MNFKKIIVALVIVTSIITGAYLFKNRPLVTTPAFTFLPGTNYHYSLALSQIETSADYALIFGTSSSGAIDLNAKLTLSPINEHEIVLTLKKIESSSKFKIADKKIPLKKILEGTQCTFIIEKDGAIDQIFFNKEEDQTVKEIIKNIISLFQWRKSEHDSFKIEERIGSNRAIVKYSKDNKKELKYYTYLSSFDLRGTTQQTRGEITLSSKESVPISLTGYFEVVIPKRYESELSFTIEKISLEKVVIPTRPKGLIKESLAEINNKKIDNKESLKAQAAGTTTQNVISLVLSQSDPKNWFHKGVAALLLDSNSHQALYNLFKKTSNIGNQTLVLDLLAAAGKERFQKILISILQENDTHSNFTQMVQRISLIIKPTPETFKYIESKIDTERTDNFNMKDSALYYTYGSLAKSFDLKTNERIFESLSEQLDQQTGSNNQDILLMSLANTGNPEAADIASDYMDSDEEKIREAAAITFGSVRSPISKEMLLKMTLDPSTRVANRAMIELKKFWLEENDYRYLVTKLGEPTEQLLGHLVAITENQTTKKMAPIIPLFIKFHNEGNYSGLIKRRMNQVIQIYNRL